MKAKENKIVNNVCIDFVKKLRHKIVQIRTLLETTGK